MTAFNANQNRPSNRHLHKISLKMVFEDIKNAVNLDKTELQYDTRNIDKSIITKLRNSGFDICLPEDNSDGGYTVIDWSRGKHHRGSLYIDWNLDN